MSERDKKDYRRLKADPAKYRAYLDRKRKERANRGDEAKRKARWRAANPEAAQRIRRANHAVEYALKYAGMVRPEACSKCGAVGPVQGHHHSYAQEHWLDVAWLCQMCHSRQHYPVAINAGTEMCKL